MQGLGSANTSSGSGGHQLSMTAKKETPLQVSAGGAGAYMSQSLYGNFHNGQDHQNSNI